ncbi:MAG: outer membrane protein assembly factor [Saprospiraceae bacterium]|nr:outer membrane protein assembly factor [Saprospiraceae bacterium]
MSWKPHAKKRCGKKYTEHLVVSNSIYFNRQKYKIQEDQDILAYGMEEVIRQKTNLNVIGMRPLLWLHYKTDSIEYKTKQHCNKGILTSDTLYVEKWLEDKTQLKDKAYLDYSDFTLCERILAQDTLQGVYKKKKRKRWAKDSLNLYNTFVEDRRIEWCKLKAEKMNPPKEYTDIALRNQSKIRKKNYFKWLKDKVIERPLDERSRMSIYYKINGTDTLKSAFVDAQLRNWLSNVGEEPIILDTAQTARTVRSMRNYLHHKGYYSATVKDSVRYNKHKALVSFYVTTNEPVLIDTVIYESADTTILKLLQASHKASLLKENKPIDDLLFEQERTRIKSFIQNKGYELFGRDHIYYEADTVAPEKRKRQKRKLFSKRWEQGEPRAVVYVKIKRYQRKKELEDHTPFTIRNVYIYPKEIIRLPYENAPKLDSIFFVEKRKNARGKDIEKPSYYYNRKDIKEDEVLTKIILYKATPEQSKNRQKDYLIKHLTLASAVRVNMGDLYTENAKKETIQRLSTLDVFNLPRVEYVRSSSGAEDELDCYIRMKPSRKQVVGFDLEANSNNSNIGTALSLLYKNRNFFKGGEIFTVNIEGGVDFILNPDSARLTGNQLSDRINMLDLNGEMKLYFPRFLPFKRVPNSILNPKSNATLGANYSQQSGFFSVLNFYAKFGYNFSLSNRVGTHLFEFNPLVLNFTPGANLSQTFEQRLITTNRALYQSLRDAYLIPSMDLSYTLTTPQNERDAWFAKFYVESAGLLWNVFDRVSQPNDTFKIVGITYSQYIKFDVDLRYSLYLGRKHSLASRLMVGLVLPYLNSSSVPFARRFNLGGANSMRAWRMRYLGPGRVKPDQGAEFQLGDIRIEFNLEYRFKFNSWIGGALFMDAGNVWVWQREQVAPDLPLPKGASGQFSSSFFKELGVGVGLGLRLDFTFLIIRLDVAMQVHNPANFGYNSDERPIYWNFSPFRRRAQNWIVAVGYPF